MFVKQIQSLIMNAIKAQLGGGSCKTHLYTKPYIKGLTSFIYPVVTSPLSSTDLIAKEIPNNTLHISLEHAVTLGQKE